MATVRAKFTVVESKVTCLGTPKEQGFLITLLPVYDANPKSENGQFYKATPSGSISLGTVNSSVAEILKVGSEVYVDFTPVG